MINDRSSRLILGRFRPVDLTRMLLVVLPSVPGLIFLAVGFVIDPHRSPQRPMTPMAQAEWARTADQTRGLYLVGAVTLFAGTLGMAAVVWKIVRTRPEDEESSPPDAAL